MNSISWWASSQSAGLSEKIGNTFDLCSVKKLLSLEGLERAKCMKDGNQGGEYFRFFGYFENDPERYFTVFGTWDLPVIWSKCKVGQFFTVGSNLWKVVDISMNGFLIEVKKL
jgi:hypothetical protein